MPDRMIPVFEPEITEQDIQAVTEAVRSGQISGSFGNCIPDFEEAFAKYCDCKYGVAVSSGTTALHVAMSALGIGPGDEVLISSCTNIATALAVYHNGATVVPVDSEEVTWNMNVDLVEGLITEKTKAIIPVHIYGHPVDMEALMEIASRHGLYVVEDAAEAHGSTINGQKVGSFGDMSCFSFYANKTITTGEGGMVVTNDEKLYAQLRSLRNLAFTQPRFVHNEAGYNFRMTGMQAALGLSQLSRIDETIAKKRALAHSYNQALAGISWLQTPTEESWAYNTYWMYCVTVKEGSAIDRDDLCKYLKSEGIDTRTFFYPMSKQPFLLESDRLKEVACPVAQSMWDSGFYLPSSIDLRPEDVAYIRAKLENYAT